MSLDWKSLAGKGWTLLDVEEKAVALSPDMLEAVCFGPEPRKFPAGSAAMNGTAVSEAEFSELVSGRASP
jgi:hypothetical protein